MDSELLRERKKRKKSSCVAQVSSKHTEVESRWTTDTKRQVSNQSQAFRTYISPELELFHIQPTQSTGKEVGFAATPCGSMCPCWLQEGMKECSEPEGGQTFSHAFYSRPGFPQSLPIWSPSYHLPVMLSGGGDREAE